MHSDLLRITLVCELNTGTILMRILRERVKSQLRAIINPRRACAARITVIFALKMLTYTAGNGGRNICGVFPETVSFRTTALPAL